MRHIAAKWRLVAAYGGFRRAPTNSLRYLAFDREVDNFTYPIANLAELSRFLAEALGTDPTTVRRYIDELRRDEELATAIRSQLAARPDRNRSMPFGRRLGWYAVARIRRPGLIVETGVHDGLGSTALLRALERNEADGFPGRLVSIDIRRSAGWLIPDDLRSRHQLVIGDPIATITATGTDRPIDMFIHDSDHRYAHETAELETAILVAAPDAVLMSDNAHASTAFSDFCARHGLHDRFWHEEPRGHFYPGAGIGLAVAGGDGAGGRPSGA